MSIYSTKLTELFPLYNETCETLIGEWNENNASGSHLTIEDKIIIRNEDDNDNNYKKELNWLDNPKFFLQYENKDWIKDLDFEVVIARAELIWKRRLSMSMINAMMSCYIFKNAREKWKDFCVNMMKVDFMPKNDVRITHHETKADPKGYILMPITYGKHVYGPFSIMYILIITIIFKFKTLLPKYLKSALDKETQLKDLFDYISTTFNTLKKYPNNTNCLKDFKDKISPYVNTSSHLPVSLNPEGGFLFKNSKFWVVLISKYLSEAKTQFYVKKAFLDLINESTYYNVQDRFILKKFFNEKCKKLFNIAESIDIINSNKKKVDKLEIYETEEEVQKYYNFFLIDPNFFNYNIESFDLSLNKKTFNNRQNNNDSSEESIIKPKNNKNKRNQRILREAFRKASTRNNENENENESESESEDEGEEDDDVSNEKKKKDKDKEINKRKGVKKKIYKDEDNEDSEDKDISKMNIDESSSEKDDKYNKRKPINKKIKPIGKNFGRFGIRNIRIKSIRNNTITSSPSESESELSNSSDESIKDNKKKQNKKKDLKKKKRSSVLSRGRPKSEKYPKNKYNKPKNSNKSYTFKNFDSDESESPTHKKIDKRKSKNAQDKKIQPKKNTNNKEIKNKRGPGRPRKSIVKSISGESNSDSELEHENVTKKPKGKEIGKKNKMTNKNRQSIITNDPSLVISNSSMNEEEEDEDEESQEKKPNNKKQK